MTIYQLLQQSGIKFTQADLNFIGKNAYSSARARKVNVSEVEQVENGVTFKVKDYPASFTEELKRIVVRYFKRKARMGENHPANRLKK